MPFRAITGTVHFRADKNVSGSRHSCQLAISCEWFLPQAEMRKWRALLIVSIVEYFRCLALHNQKSKESLTLVSHISLFFPFFNKPLSPAKYGLVRKIGRIYSQGVHFFIFESLSFPPHLILKHAVLLPYYVFNTAYPNLMMSRFQSPLPRSFYIRFRSWSALGVSC